MDQKMNLNKSDARAAQHWPRPLFSTSLEKTNFGGLELVSTRSVSVPVSESRELDLNHE